MLITMAKLRMAHASTHGAGKPPGPKKEERERLNDGNNNGQATHGAGKPPGPKITKAFQNVIMHRIKLFNTGYYSLLIQFLIGL